VNPVAVGKCQISDPCLYCSSGLGHPPAIVVYDPAKGGYYLRAEEEEKEVCTARRRGAGGGYTQGDICGSLAVYWAADMPLCEAHHKRLQKWMAGQADITGERNAHLHEQRLRQEEELDRKRNERAVAQVAAMAEAKSPYSVVYYIRRTSDGAVKIGFSASLENRVKALRVRHGSLETLLVLGGDRVEEGDAHNKFRRYQIGRTEWFRPVRPLLDWIAAAREDTRRVQPSDVLRLNDLRELAAAAVPEEDLQWDENGHLRWPSLAA
jgi:hypothetical protein